MGISKVVVASILISLFVLHVAQGFQTNHVSSNIGSSTSTGDAVTGAKIDCAAACGVRCSATKRPNLCKRACGSCCRDCNCVPPGTSGNYEACLCYATKTTRGNVRKCP
ncbi:hypothetical protein RND81_14G215800 [Saponaria officinalis]|uniref:Uncharacterized protein n=1 Tax=Saponaria officinalis TaxID=3572 RepID=A0AAW1H0F3_SAPOF